MIQQEDDEGCHGLGTLYLIPNTLGSDSFTDTIPTRAQQVVGALTHYLAEGEKSARHFIKLVAPEVNLRSLNIQRLDKNTSNEMLSELLSPIKLGLDVGVISEAGCPGIADPGSIAVRYAHGIGARVVPLVGPNSMMLALIASGLNGQAWRFHGYLPFEAQGRTQAIASIQREALQGITQIVMETPYRNQKLLEELILTLEPSLTLSVAVALTTPDEKIISQHVKTWRASRSGVLGDLSKVPAVFLVGV